MSLVFGDVTQIAYVTNDFDNVLAFFINSGIGPWFVAKKRMMKNINYRGDTIDIEISVGVANSGSLQLEVIQQTNGVRSVYTDWLHKNPGQLLVQHICSWPVDFHGAEKKILAAGYTAAMAGTLDAGPFGYYEHPDRPGFIFEATELSPARRYVWETVAEGARKWDGKEPIRPWPVLG